MSLVVGLVIFPGWSAYALFSRVYTQWADKPEDVVIIRNEALQSIQKGYRVYFSNQMFHRSADTWLEGSSFYL